MFDNKTRQQLQVLQDRLNVLKDDRVFKRAQRFHKLHSQLQERIRTHLQRWALWVNAEQVISYQRQVHQLEQLAPGMTALVHEVEVLERELDQFAHKLEWAGWLAADAELAAILNARCDKWRRQLESVGANCEWQSELFQDSDKVEQIKDTLRLHSQAVEWLQQAVDILDRLGATPKADRLRTELPGLRQQFMQAGPSQAWLQTLRLLCQSLQPEVAQSPPPELQQVANMMAELRGWIGELQSLQDDLNADKAEELRRFKEQCMQLEKDQRRLQAEWRQQQADQFQQLLQSAQQLRERLIAIARQWRSQELQSLQDLKDDLTFVCGPQPKLEQHLETLVRQHQAIERYQAHRAWLAELNKAHEYFKAVLSIHSIELSDRLEGRIQRLQEDLQKLCERPLSDEVRRQAERLTQEVDQLTPFQGLEELLGGLRRCKDLETRLQQLGRQDQQEREALLADQRTLQARNAALQASAPQLDVSLEDLTTDIDRLSGGSISQTLVQARQLARQLDSRLAAIEQQFLQDCREWLAADLDSLSKACNALRQAGYPCTLPQSPTLEGITAPQEATRIVIDLRQEKKKLHGQVQQALEECDDQRRRQQQELARLQQEALGSADEWERAEQLLRELEKGSWSQTQDELERLRRLSELLRKVDDFCNRLSEERRRFQQRLSVLKQRLQAFKEEDELQRFCPEFSERVTDLVYGIPEYPRHWRSIQPQLRQAEELFTRLAAQARRLAAQELETAVAKLRRLPERNEASVQSLLAELDRQGQQQLPPSKLRNQVLSAIGRGAGHL